MDGRPGEKPADPGGDKQPARPQRGQVTTGDLRGKNGRGSSMGHAARSKNPRHKSMKMLQFNLRRMKMF